MSICFLVSSREVCWGPHACCLVLLVRDMVLAIIVKMRSQSIRVHLSPIWLLPLWEEKTETGRRRARKDRHTDAEGRRPCEDGGDDVASQRTYRLPEVWKGKERLLPRGFRGSVVWPTSGFWTSSSWKWWENTFLLSSATQLVLICYSSPNKLISKLKQVVAQLALWLGTRQEEKQKPSVPALFGIISLYFNTTWKLPELFPHTSFS